MGHRSLIRDWLYMSNVLEPEEVCRLLVELLIFVWPVRCNKIENDVLIIMGDQEQLCSYNFTVDASNPYRLVHIVCESLKVFCCHGPRLRLFRISRADCRRSSGSPDQMELSAVSLARSLPRRSDAARQPRAPRRLRLRQCWSHDRQCAPDCARSAEYPAPAE